MDDGFLARLRLDQVGDSRWRAPVDRGRPERSSQGLLAARAMIAAGHTVDTRWRWVHSVHLVRLSDGDLTGPVEYRVDRLRDDAHLSTRLVSAVRSDTPVASVTVSFQTARPGLGHSYQLRASAVDPPDPHTLSGVAVDAGGGPIDVRCLDGVLAGPAASASRAANGSPNRMWFRMTKEIPDQILPHAAALLLAADRLLSEAMPVGALIDLATGRALRPVRLDLSMHFHRSFRADDWVLHEHETVTASNYRAYTAGRFYSSMGRLIASVSQETALVPVGGTATGLGRATAVSAGTAQ